MPHLSIRSALFAVRLAVALPSLAVLGGCGEEADDEQASGEQVAPQKAIGGYATGRITMPDGTPITAPYEELSFYITGTALHGENASFTPVIKPDGTYKQKLSAGSFTFAAGSSSTIKLPYEGKTYTLQLEPVGPNWKRNRESDEGIVQDYVWKPTGEASLFSGGNVDVNNFTHWYGGSVGVRMGTWRQDIGTAPGKVPDGAKCVFTLTPTVAKTIDGQPAKTLTIERTFSAQWSKCDNLNDLPIAHYTLTGEIHFPDGTKKPMLWHVTYAKYLPSQPVRFEPDDRIRAVTGVSAEWVIE